MRIHVKLDTLIVLEDRFSVFDTVKLLINAPALIRTWALEPPSVY